MSTPPRRELDPTREALGELQAAFDHFNARLFGNRLPRALITYTRRARCYGHFGSRHWERKDGARADEIAMNPGYFRDRPSEEVLSTLVHEMVHLEQHHFGAPSRPGYHNREWAALMRRAGLVPSDTGEPGGRATGQRMSHYIAPGGPFEAAARALVGNGHELSWARGALQAARPAGGRRSRARTATKTKTAYTCPGCGIKVWGKPSLAPGMPRLRRAPARAEAGLSEDETDRCRGAQFTVGAGSPEPWRAASSRRSSSCRPASSTVRP